MGPAYVSPAYCVFRVPVGKIRANAYNPNAVPPPEMQLLVRSILEDGYTMPLVCYYLAGEDCFEIVDGFHRYMAMVLTPEIAQREGNCLPVTVIDKPLTSRMASTIRHNRARGVHSIDLMTTIVAQLVEAGLGDDWIMKNIGMDRDELLRLKQLSGLAALFKDREFSPAWESDSEAP
ncbi:MAG: ParB/RepB/Spo0J family partition protein [Firmicutes bacterium]|nr:ParB/RepB/Spo0J family partition protein [Bacillota bacterium]